MVYVFYDSDSHKRSVCANDLRGYEFGLIHQPLPDDDISIIVTKGSRIVTMSYGAFLDLELQDRHPEVDMLFESIDVALGELFIA